MLIRVASGVLSLSKRHSGKTGRFHPKAYEFVVPTVDLVRCKMHDYLYATTYEFIRTSPDRAKDGRNGVKLTHFHPLRPHRRNNKALLTTVTELIAIAAPAIMGLSIPNAANGMPSTL